MSIMEISLLVIERNRSWPAVSLEEGEGDFDRSNSHQQTRFVIDIYILQYLSLLS